MFILKKWDTDTIQKSYGNTVKREWVLEYEESLIP